MSHCRWPHLDALSLAAALGGLLWAMPLAAQTVAQTAMQAVEPPAHGLIVRLKSPPAHADLNPRATHPRMRESALNLSTHESARWGRVLVDAGLSASSGRREPRLRPVGRDQQLLEFERPLSRAEAEQLRDKLLQRPDVDWVEPNLRERRLQVPPTDPLFAQQWWLQPVSGSNANVLAARLRGVANFQNAWLRMSTAPVVVAVLDTGITAHPDLQGRVLPGYDFVREAVYANDGGGRDNDPADPGDWVSAADLANPDFAGCGAQDSSWHGTITSGMVAANASNGQGGAGIAWAANVLPVRVAGKCGADVPDIIDGMRWAAGLEVAGVERNPNPARIINISFGGSAACGPAYQSAVDELRAIGVVVVAAAGNEWRAPTRPANCAGVVGVAGLNRDGFKTNYSNFGAQLAASGIATVAGDDDDGAWGRHLADSGLVTLTNPGFTAPAPVSGNNGYARLYGTSFAAPQVSGTIALMLGVNPQLNHAQVLEGLRLSARPHVTSPTLAACSDANPGRCICSTQTCGVGILDAERAWMYASGLVLPAVQAAVIDNVDIDRALALAPQDRSANTVAAPSGGSDGGGAFGAFWLLALATAAIALRFVLLPAHRR